ncbi:MAG: nicotinate-nucleotide--dimethylbenzimidazole phosphoribosyltransferase [Pseudomonadota bacterium]|nr:nicotinate-nucleotide--dimethylbenzimidazole phosphoribosyltransferase [Pseudomonadota bacterium]
MSWWIQPPPEPDQAIAGAATHRQRVLTKPPGALGRLETLAIRLAAQQARPNPMVDRVFVAVFAADHGVVARGVSVFPQAVTVQMLRNFVQGGAAISVLARQWDASLEVVDVGTCAAEPVSGVIDARIASGTADFVIAPAMSSHQCEQALGAGRASVDRAVRDGARLYIGGEMGIGNTTVASALACALMGESPQGIVGPGTGLDADGVARKAAVVAQALRRHQAVAGRPLSVLASLGGFEIAALTGAFIAAAQERLPVLVDGFIASVAALAAVKIQPGVGSWLHFAHRSAEPGHQTILEALEAEPLLDLGMRLGEGSGAAVAIPLLRAACALHNKMATFEEASVADGG